MLSIIIPTLQAAATLDAVLTCLNESEMESEIIICDGGSRDATKNIAQKHHAQVIESPPGRGHQMAAGAEVSGGDWLLFLHADTVPGQGWQTAIGNFVSHDSNSRRAAVFKFALDDPSMAARRLESIVAWRSRVLGLPYGDQGLLISRRLYNEIGGFRSMPLYEDVDIIRRIGRRRLARLEIPAVTSAARYRQSGYILRPLRNFACLSLYFAGLPPKLIGRLYQ